MSNTENQWSDEQLYAYVDGELPPTDATRLAQHLTHDPVLAVRVNRQRMLREQLARSFDAVLNEPVPQRLLDALDGRSSGATPIGAARGKPGARPAPLWWGAAAATVLLAAMLGWLLPRTPDGPFVQREGAWLAAGALDSALSQRLAADDAGAAGVRVAFSVRNEDGRYCRVFSLDAGLDGLACRDARGWLIEATGRPGAESDPDQYRQAGSSLSPSVLGALASQQTGDALTAEEESRARDGGWQ